MESILSPLLFNLYMAKMPNPPENIKLVTYADDSTVLSSGPRIEPLCQDINRYLDVLHAWFAERNLQISAPKSSATIFTTFSNEVKQNLPIHIKGAKVPTLQDPKILGVTFDPMLSFKHHIKDLKQKVNSRTNIIKALAGSTWGCEKEVLLTTYGAISKSCLNYGAPVWTPEISRTNRTELQTAKKTPPCHLPLALSRRPAKITYTKRQNVCLLVNSCSPPTLTAPSMRSSTRRA